MLRAAGIEVRRYCPERSDAARLHRIFSYYHTDLVLDVGANTGQYAQYIRFVGYAGKIVSFEPLGRTYSELLKVSKNDDLWEIAPRTAIGDRDGEIMINVSQNSVSSSILPMLESHRNFAPESVYTDSESVPIHRLDTIAPAYIGKDKKSVYLKIDVQGFEKNVLDGATQILPEMKGLQLELSLVPLYEGELLFTDMLDKLDKLGYELHALIPGFTDNESGRLLQADGIFFRREE